MPRPLDGIRVIDLSNGPAAGIATMVMADFGAEVIKVEQPSGDPFRSMPSAPMWLRGKQSVALDLALPEGQERLKALVATADVVVSSYRPGSDREFGADYETLRQGNPGLVFTHVTAFGPNGPLANLPPYEPVVAAKGGRMMAFEGTAPRTGPVFSALQVTHHAAAMATVMGTVGALVARERTGEGQLVETSLLQGLMPYDMAGLAIASLMARDHDKWKDAVPPGAISRMPTINYQPVMAADGKWIQLGNLLQHLFDNFVASADLADIFADERFQGSPAGWKEEDREAFRDRMFTRMREKDSAEWQRIFVENGGVVSTIFQTTQDALSDPDMVDNGHVVEFEGGRKLIGPVARMTATPAEVTANVPEVGEHQSVLDQPREAWQPNVTSGPQGGALHGITVLDFSTIIAAPLGCTHLADLGARVIKVEQIGGDPWRWMGNGSLGAIKTNGGKESISVDLKSPEGQEVVRRLMAQADVMVHNFRPGVPARLGMSYQHAVAENPGMIYVNVNGYGTLGPSAHRPATHPIPGAALGGATWQTGVMPTGTSIPELREGARRLFRANEVNPDPNTSAVVAATVTLALYARANHGVGQEIFVDMMGANAYANWDDFLWYEGKEPRPGLDEDLRGTGPLNRLYETQDGWAVLCLPLEVEWEEFCRLAAPDLATDSRFTSRTSRADHAEALTEILVTLFGQRPADEWERLLGGAGLGCVRADGPGPGDYWHTAEQVAANTFKETVHHTRHGEMERHGPMARMHGTPNTIASAPLAGEQTDAILTELGYDAGEIAALRASNVVWSEDAVPVTTG
ncbi:MAG: CoA transferase [Dehalococcoidia bacterium]|nr:CoA transferase [Dehalococcoidia bacterium]